MKQLKNLKVDNQGQAMTEFIISASFFLIPLFLGLSLIAKYIDIKQANVQAARYQAWEYTVWFANDTERGIDYNSGSISNGGEVSGGFTEFDLPVKTTAITRDEAKRRFYSNPGNEDTTLEINSSDGITGWETATANPLWKDHTGMRLYQGVDGSGSVLTSSTETPTLPVVGDVMNFILEGIGLVFGVVADLMSAIGSNVGFNAITTEGYAMSTESMRIARPANYRTLLGLDDSLATNSIAASDFNFMSKASVLSDGWNAGGKEHTYNQVGGMVPTTLLNELFNQIPGFTTIWNIASVLAPELRLCNPGPPWPSDDKGSLWLGHIDIDAVHPDRLVPDLSKPDENNGTHQCENGFCDFDPVVPRTEDSRTCR